MRVFVAGATGAIGRRLVPMLVRAGHQVVGTTRFAEKAAAVEAAGAQAVTMDPLNPDAVLEAVTRAKPDVVVHQLTALTGTGNLRKFDEEFALTNRLRSEGTDNLLAASRTAGAQRLVAQSFTGWPYQPIGSSLRTEDDPLDPNPPRQAVKSLQAIKHLESTVTGATDVEGVVLRYGYFYGPGTGIARDGQYIEMVRHRQFPIVGDGTGVWSFCHIDDAASATVAAIERGAPGIYNIVDEEPAPVAEWLPYLAEVVGAKRPRRVPVWLARLMVGDLGIAMMTTMRGVSNEKAKRELGWQPAYGSWRTGFRTGLG